MPTRATEGGEGVGTAAKHVAEHAKTLVRLELELAALELKTKVGSLATGIAMGVAAALVGVFVLAFALAAAAAGLANVVDTWLALLLVAAGLLVLTAVLGMLALRAVKRGAPPVPKQAIDEAKRTTEALRSNGGR